MVCFGFGYIRSIPEARAADPAACPQYECKTIHASWSAVNEVRAEFLINNGGNSDDFFYDIFTQNSVEKKDSAATNQQIDEKIIDTCIPTCGKDTNGVWQAPQEVSIPQGAMVISTSRINQSRCTAANGAGPQVTPPKNYNEKNYEPPQPKVPE